MRDKGLGSVGAPVYAEHPSTQILWLAWRIPGMAVGELWSPFADQPPPAALFDYVRTGGVLECHNAMFEWLHWPIAVRNHGFPALGPYQLRCSMAKARVAGFPGKLARLAEVLGVTPKDKEGDRLIRKFSVPRDPTKSDARTRTMPHDDWPDFLRFGQYCLGDIGTEREASARLPVMTSAELEFWWIDQEINRRGIGIDRPAVRACIVILEQILTRYGEEFRTLTGGLEPTQLAALQGWLAAQGVFMPSMDGPAVADVLARPMPPSARRALEIRQLTGSASVKKLYAIEHQATHDDRLCDVIQHHGARTGRPTAEGAQPFNLPRGGPALRWCKPCGKPYRHDALNCPWCGALCGPTVSEWSFEAVEEVLRVIAWGSLDLVEHYFGDAIKCISGCLRSLFVARDGYDLIASDYSSIESVVTACLAGEQWRIEAFREGKPMYLMGASKITGKPLEFYLAYKEQHGHHHPDRQKIGKTSELLAGFGGWIGAMRRGGAEGTDDELRDILLGWRNASPKIVEMWGGQFRRGSNLPEYYGFEGAAIQALLYPGNVYTSNGIEFFKRGHALIIRLLSGRELTYNHAAITPSERPFARPGQLDITYWGWNSSPLAGPIGWQLIRTYGGKITENIIQAVAHDILRHAILLLRAHGYPTVLHVYDETVLEILIGFGSIEEVERLMSQMPWWCADWPIKASGGWRGRRFRKA